MGSQVSFLKSEIYIISFGFGVRYSSILHGVTVFSSAEPIKVSVACKPMLDDVCKTLMSMSAWNNFVTSISILPLTVAVPFQLLNVSAYECVYMLVHDSVSLHTQEKNFVALKPSAAADAEFPIHTRTCEQTIWHLKLHFSSSVVSDRIVSDAIDYSDRTRALLEK
jgi:hypothetical protein